MIFACFTVAMYDSYDNFDRNMPEIISHYRENERIMDTSLMCPENLQTLLTSSGVEVEFHDQEESKIIIKYFLKPEDPYDQTQTLQISLPKLDDVKIGYLIFKLSKDGQEASSIRKGIHLNKIPGVEVRGKGFMSTAHSILAEYLKQRGVLRIVQSIPSGNFPSIFSGLKTRSLSDPKRFFMSNTQAYQGGYDVTTDLTQLITASQLQKIIDTL